MALSNLGRWLTGLWLCLVLLGSTEAKIIYVDDDAVASGDGSSWQTAYKFLQDALADANDAEKPVEIRVAQGTYKPDGGTRVKAGDYKATFRLISGVALKGGFGGLGAPDPNVRDVAMHETILSGDLHGDDPDVNDPGDLPLSLVSPNSDIVITGSGTDSTAVLDGFVVTAGYHYLDPAARIRPGAPPRPLEGWGGGMNNAAGSPTVIGCTFVGNMSTFSGAAMCNVEGSHPMVIDCVFAGNYAVGGGALANWNDSNSTVTGCTFRDNVAGREGGAVRNGRSSPIFTDCTFTENKGGAVCNSRSAPTFAGCSFARNSGSAVYAEESICTLTDCTFMENEAPLGGALYSRDGNQLFLERCTFIGNSSAQAGGAILGWGKNDNFIITACIFRENSSHGSGGAMDLWGQAQVSHCIFSGNSCRSSGGAVDIRGGTFANCLFVGNRAFDRGTRSDQTWFPGTGGAVSHPYSLEALHFTNCTFNENHATFGSAVYTSDGWPDFRDCILRGRQPLIWADPYGPHPQVVYSDVEGGWPGQGNMDMDPLFAAPGCWADPNEPNRPGDPNDPNTIWVDGDYHLKSQAGRWGPTTDSWVIDDVTSPCIDTGDPNSPVDDEPEPNGGRINMGAYGGTREASMSFDAGP